MCDFFQLYRKYNCHQRVRLSVRKKNSFPRDVLHFAKKTKTKIRKSRFSLRRIEHFVDKLSYRYLSMTVRDDIVDYSNANDSYIIRTRPHKFNSIRSTYPEEMTDSIRTVIWRIHTNPNSLRILTYIYTAYILIHTFLSVIT